MFKAVWNDTEFFITSLPTLTDSSRETKFSEIEVDFRGKLDSDLPIQFQEVKIIDENNNVYLTGYVDSVDFPEFAFEDQPFIIRISLLSPYAYASKRTLSKTIDTVALNTVIVEILQPLLDDGFTIEENELNGKLVSEIFQAETIEKILNYLANKFSFIWYIDKDKKIYLKDIDILQGQAPLVEVIDSDRCYLQTIKPIKTVVDYANKLVIKNAIILGGTSLPSETVLSLGEMYKFEYPISISENTAFRLTERYFDGDVASYANSFYMLTDTGEYEIQINLTTKTINTGADIGIMGIDDDTSKKILLEVDPIDSTKVTGFKWNAASETVVFFTTQSALLPVIFSFVDPVQIANIKTQMNTSGVIEKIVNANGKYFTYNELLDYVANLFKQNNVLTNEVNCVFKGRLDDTDFMTIANNLQITKVFRVNLPNFLIDGNFIITDKTMSFNRETLTIGVRGRNFNLNENFNDIYRLPMEQLSTSDLNNVAVVLYNQDNKTVISKEIIVDGVVINND